MDHRIIPRPWKTCDWLLNSSPDNFGLHQWKNVKVTIEFDVPKDIFGGLHYPLQSSLYKYYPYKRYNFIYVKEILLSYKNTIGKTSECYVLSVIACSTPFFVNCTSVSVNFEKIKVIIHESIHFKHVFTFIPYSLRTSQILFFMEILPPCALSSNLGEEMANKEGLGVGVHVGC